MGLLRVSRAAVAAAWFVSSYLVQRVSSQRPANRARRAKDQPFTPFLPATVFFLPLRVRELDRVRWPLTGRLLR